MTRIVYLAFTGGGIQGGKKMIVRHVEALRELGFDAVLWTNEAPGALDWLEHSVPVEHSTELNGDDLLVLPEDVPEALGVAAGRANRTVIFCQSPFRLATVGLPALDRFPAGRAPAFMVVGPMLRDLVRRLYPAADVALVPCFADERMFRPCGPVGEAIVGSPRKRPGEAAAIRELFPRLHPRHADRPWRMVEDAPEREVAAAFAASPLFLSLSRLESVGMTPLEAMASGCVCAGFLGVGGREWASEENGFWVDDDDCVAAADALARAADVVQSGGAELARRCEAGFETARAWSRARFLPLLEETWMRLAPEARRRAGPLDV